MTNRHWVHRFGSLLACAGGLMAAPLYAQSVSPVTVTPPSLIPERRDNGMRVDSPEAGALQAPAGAEGMGVTLGDARLEGGFV